jgi:hypothetical protein
MSKIFLEISYPSKDDAGDYDAFEVTIQDNEWDFSSSTDKAQYDKIIADGNDKTEVDTFIQSRVDEAEPEEEE